jgi:single-strand DNA-binding protein
MLNVNKCFFSGRISKDIELQYTTKGTAVVKFSIAVDNSYKDATGQWVNRAFFPNFVAYDKTAEFINAHASKGVNVYLECEYEIREYTDKESQQRKSHEFKVSRVQTVDKPKGEPLPDKPADTANNDDVPF